MSLSALSGSIWIRTLFLIANGNFLLYSFIALDNSDLLNNMQFDLLVYTIQNTHQHFRLTFKIEPEKIEDAIKKCLLI